MASVNLTDLWLMKLKNLYYGEKVILKTMSYGEKRAKPGA
jgi:hypothetical protein